MATMPQSQPPTEWETLVTVLAFFLFVMAAALVLSDLGLL